MAGNRASLITELENQPYPIVFLQLLGVELQNPLFDQSSGAFAASERDAITVGRALLRWCAPERTCQITRPRSDRQTRLFFSAREGGDGPCPPLFFGPPDFRPLGGFLFACPSLKRGEVELARLAPGNAVYERAMARLQLPPQPLWGRRSVFRLQDKPLLVAEIFLPAIETLPTSSC